MFERTQSRLVLFWSISCGQKANYKWRSYQADRPLVVTWGWFTSGPNPNYQWSTVIYIWCANGGSPTVGQQRLSGHANGGPTTHLSLVYRWANGGSTEAYRWLAIAGPTAHLSLVYRWPTVGPTVASHRWANRGPPVASHRWPNGGPTEAHRWL